MRWAYYTLLYILSMYNPFEHLPASNPWSVGTSCSDRIRVLTTQKSKFFWVLCKTFNEFSIRLEIISLNHVQFTILFQNISKQELTNIGYVLAPPPFWYVLTYPNLFEQLTRPITSIVSSSQTIALLIVFLPLFFMSAASKSKSYEHLIDFMTSFCTTTINFETRLVRGV